jgi:hypothetical protein
MYAQQLGQDLTVTDTGITSFFGPAVDTTPTIDATATPAPAATGGGWFSDILATIGTTVQTVAQSAAEIAPGVLSIVQQNKLIEVNAQRAAKGLPPLTAAQYSAQYVPTPTVGVSAGINPATMRSIFWIAGGLAGVAVLVSLIGRR